MKFWYDYFDTYAAETLDDVKKEQIADGLIDEAYWDADCWRERDGSALVWMTPMDEISAEDKMRMIDDPKFRGEMIKSHCKSLEEIINSPDLRPLSKTGKAWLLGSTEV